MQAREGAGRLESVVRRAPPSRRDGAWRGRRGSLEVGVRRARAGGRIQSGRGGDCRRARCRLRGGRANCRRPARAGLCRVRGGTPPRSRRSRGPAAARLCSLGEWVLDDAGGVFFPGVGAGSVREAVG